LDLFFFGKYSTAFQVTANQSAVSDLEKNDLQVGMGTADNTGSSVKFENMEHENGLIKLVLGTRSIPTTRIFKANTTDVYREIGATSITLPTTCAGTNTPYVNGSNGFVIGKPSTSTVTIASTGVTSANRYLNWTISGTYTKNTATILTPVSTRGYVYYGRAYDYTGNVQTFTASEAGTYKLEVWGAQGRSDGLERPGGLGGYSYGNYKSRANMNIYVCVGQEGPYGYPAYNNRRQDQPYFESGSSGGGATSITTNLDNRGTGELINYENYKDEILIVAGGGGGDDYGPLTDGYGGGLKGGDANGTGATTEKAGITTTGEGIIVTEATFGVGGYGYFKEGNDYGGQGGGGYYGGGGASANGSGGGGSGYVNTTLLTNNASTIAGNTSFPSPSGGTETGHTGNGYAIITQVSY